MFLKLCYIWSALANWQFHSFKFSQQADLTNVVCETLPKRCDNLNDDLKNTWDNIAIDLLVLTARKISINCYLVH